MYPKSAEMTVLKQSKCKNKTLKIRLCTQASSALTNLQI